MGGEEIKTNKLLKTIQTTGDRARKVWVKISRH